MRVYYVTRFLSILYHVASWTNRVQYDRMGGSFIIRQQFRNLPNIKIDERDMWLSTILFLCSPRLCDTALYDTLRDRRVVIAIDKRRSFIEI